MPSQQLVNDLDTIINENRKRANLPPLVSCLGNCGRKVEAGYCGTCEVRVRLFLQSPTCGVCLTEIIVLDQAALVQLRDGTRYLAHTQECLRSSLDGFVDRAMQPRRATA